MTTKKEIDELMSKYAIAKQSSCTYLFKKNEAVLLFEVLNEPQSLTITITTPTRTAFLLNCVSYKNLTDLEDLMFRSMYVNWHIQR